MKLVDATSGKIILEGDTVRNYVGEPFVVTSTTEGKPSDPNHPGRVYARPLGSALVQRLYPVTLGLRWEEPSVMYKIEVLQEHLGMERYRAETDAKRRPDGRTITKSMRQCIDELFEEYEL